MTHRANAHDPVGPIDAATARQVAETMQALATGSRVQILAHLSAEACSVGALAEAIGMEQSAVSHQLRLLRHLGLVVGERVGRRTIYGLHDAHVGDLVAQAVHHVHHVRLGLAASPGTSRRVA